MTAPTTDPSDIEAAFLMLDLWGSFDGRDGTRNGMQLLNRASFYLMHRQTYPEPCNPLEGCR